MRVLSGAVALAIALALPAVATAQDENARYALANGCYAIGADGAFVVKDGAGGYSATAAQAAGAEGFRMKATALGHYLLYGKGSDFMAGSPSGDVQHEPNPSDSANWQVDNAGPGKFTLSLPTAGKELAAGDGGKLVLVPVGSGTAFSFEPADGCAAFPESDTNAVGTPTKGATPYGTVSGFLDAHMHMMAFEFLGGRAHCGRPWSPFGAPTALVDCPDHYPNGAGAVLENAISFGNPAHTHDPVGWPTFKDWPNPKSLTHENSYYKWVERAWRGGLRTYVNLFVENKVLCEVYPLKQNSCDEMDAVRLQAKRIRELEDYIDAQYGGPGKGWFRIVTDPYQARRVINEGKLAVVLGIEVSEPFGCQVYNDQPMCDEAQIDAGLDEVYKLGVRDMEIVNKFDNALAGVAGDSGNTGLIVNGANKLETGKFWQMETCHGPAGASDKEQPTPFTHNTDALLANGLATVLPAGAAPVYPAGPHCNTRGLTPLGEHLIRRMIEKKMVVDPDHLSVLARDQVMSVLESERYSGVVSSHSWSTADSYPRIYNLGGVIAPYAGSSLDFAKAWEKVKPMRNSKYYWGIGYGADMNGFGGQGAPRLDAPNPVKYPFKSFDGNVTLDRQHSGERVFDINKDGVANYGMFPDWIEDLRQIAGDQIVEDLSRGSEAYLQMWERAQGAPDPHCQAARARFTSAGLGDLRLRASHRQLLDSAGQPSDRPGRLWRYCVDGQGGGAGRATVALTPGGRVALVASTARFNRARGVGPGGSARRLGVALRRGLVMRLTGHGSAIVYGVRGGRVRFVALTTRAVAKRPSKLRSYLRLAGLR